MCLISFPPIRFVLGCRTRTSPTARDGHCNHRATTAKRLKWAALTSCLLTGRSAWSVRASPAGDATPISKLSGNGGGRSPRMEGRHDVCIHRVITRAINAAGGLACRDRRQFFSGGVAMFGFYSNQLGCLGSLVVSVIGTIILILVIRSCSG